jgi:cytochrome c5
MKKIFAIGLALFAASAFAQDGVMAKYDKSCKVCHATGAAGAPKTGDAAAWAPRLDKGMDVLVVSVSNGLNAMPPKGMCFDCSDADYAALIEYMSTPAE